MSRFSRNTASGLGYLLFALVGGSAYWFLKYDSIHTEVAVAERSQIPLPVALGSSLDCATELSAVITETRMDDPLVNLGANQVPTWATGKSIDDLDALVSIPASQELPSEYPHGKIRPLSLPRSGDALIKEPKKTVLSLAPQPVQNVSDTHTSNQFTNTLPLVPLRSGLSAPQPIAQEPPQLTETAATEDWQTKSKRMFNDFSRTLMKPPPQSSVSQSSSTQKVVLSRRPVVQSEVEPAAAINPASQPNWQKPSVTQSKFIVQPIN